MYVKHSIQLCISADGIREEVHGCAIILLMAIAATHYLLTPYTHTPCSLTSMTAQSILLLASYVKNS